MATSPALRVTGVLQPNPEAHEVSSQISTGPISASHLIKLHLLLRCHIFLP